MGRLSNLSPRVLGWLALACWAVRAAAVLHADKPLNLLWACNCAALAVAAGLLARSATAVAVGVLWLSIGIPLWLLDTALGAPLEPTSILPHVGGLVLGLAGLRRLGLPAGSWRRACLALLALQQFCRWTTPFRENVNVSTMVWPGWEKTFPSYPVFWAALFALAAVVFAAAERGCRRYLAIPAEPDR